MCVFFTVYNVCGVCVTFTAIYVELLFAHQRALNNKIVSYTISFF